MSFSQYHLFMKTYIAPKTGMEYLWHLCHCSLYLSHVSILNQIMVLFLVEPNSPSLLSTQHSVRASSVRVGKRDGIYFLSVTCLSLPSSALKSKDVEMNRKHFCPQRIQCTFGKAGLKQQQWCNIIGIMIAISVKYYRGQEARTVYPV